ncbi:MAG: hypothetical protein U5L95_04330 [Candidatus Saccharibacteria bacterium]|nr:hypothetical protein [Candidatus Saccharibacteria bacterium]
MQNTLLKLAHAGAEHGSEAEAAAHRSDDSVTMIIVVTAVTLIVLVLAVRFLTSTSKRGPKENKPGSIKNEQK